VYSIPGPTELSQPIVLSGANTVTLRWVSVSLFVRNPLTGM
jgi:hypothetical protein